MANGLGRLPVPSAKATDQDKGLFRQALALHEAGRLQESAMAYRSILAIWPDHVGALCYLGMVICQMGHPEAALPFLEKSVALAPNSAQTHANLAQALKQLGRLDAALVSYRQAASLQPNDPWCQYNVGVVLQQLAHRDDALASYREVLRLAPNFPRAHNNLGKLLQEMGQPEAAVASYRRALEQDASFFEAQFNLGKVLVVIGKLDEAVTAFISAVDLQHNDPRAFSYLGAELLKLDQPEAAGAAFEKQCLLQPNNWEGHYNLGCALGRIGVHAEAVSSFRRAIELQPVQSDAHYNLGVALKNLGQFDAALESLEQAVVLNPDSLEALNNLGLVLLALGRLDEGLACLRQVLERSPDRHVTHSNLLFALNLLPGHTMAQILEEARAYGEKVSVDIVPNNTWLTRPILDKRLRIGLVSGDLHSHPVGYFLEGAVAELDPSLMELYAYVTHQQEDALTERLKPHFIQWNQVNSLSDEELAERIRGDAIDILIDLSGHTDHNRLPAFTRKPAPVQVTWLGYFATTGVPGMDYLLGDSQVVPSGEEVYFSETVWRLPDIYYCFTPPDVAIEPSPLPALSNAYITFGCSNRLSKMNDGVVQTWAKLLLALPTSKLLLKASELINPIRQQVIQARFAALGIESDRLILEASSPRPEYLATYQRVDIALDPFPYPGGTTTVEGLWMEVPVVTLKGDRFIGHQGETILHNAGLSDWIARDQDDYVAKAVAFAGDLAALSDLRAGLRSQLLASPVCDAPRFARHFEAALRGMWRQWCAASGAAG